MISSILSPFWAVFVTLHKNMMNVMRYLLHFITVFTTTTSDHKLFRKILPMAGEIPSQDPKIQTDERACTGLILYGDIENVKQFMGDFVKVETNVHFCPLVSRIELFYSSNLGRMNEVASTGDYRDHDDPVRDRGHPPIRKSEEAGWLCRLRSRSARQRTKASRERDHEIWAEGIALGLGGSLMAGSPFQSKLAGRI